MQTLTEIKQLLEQFGLAPQKQFGQNFLFDQNLLAKIVELAGLSPDQTVLEVGPGTGSMTEELLKAAGRVVAVEIDHGMFRLLSQRFADQPRLTLVESDALSGKHALSPQVLQAVGGRAVLVSNLPYNIATPLVAQALICSWQSLQSPQPPLSCRFDRLVFTVQQEVADRFIAPCGSWQYGPVSVIVALLGKMQFGPAVPNSAFWPRPQVVSRAARIDFDEASALQVADVPALKAMLSLAFNQRRKQIGSVVHRKNSSFEPDDFASALHQAGIERTVRAEQITPEQFRLAANALKGKLKTDAPSHEAGLE